ncbi:MAG: ATPase domain-containing protein [Candidatus Helarchaeota archaeon]
MATTAYSGKEQEINRRVPTFITGFDDLIEGGFVKNSLNLISGSAGSGKTIFCLQYIYNCVKFLKEPGVFITLEESVDSIKRTMKRFGFDIEKYEYPDKFSIADLGSIRKELSIEEEVQTGGLLDVNSLIEYIKGIVSLTGASRLVIDSMTALGIKYNESGIIRQVLFRLGRFLREINSTVLITTESIPYQNKLTRFDIEQFISDSFILLNLIEINGSLKRTLIIRKMRQTNHDMNVHQYKITSKGFEILMIIEKNEVSIYELALTNLLNNKEDLLWDYFYDFLKDSEDWSNRFDSEEISILIVGNLRLHYKYIKKYGITIIIILDLHNNIDVINEIFNKVATDLEDNPENLLEGSKEFETYVDIFLSIQQRIPIKVALVGFGGVGKTTVLKLIKQEELPTRHLPTILADITQYNLNGIYFSFWDFAGQVAYKKVWPKLINKSDLVIVVTDSTQQNVSLSKFFLDLIQNVVPYSKKLILANKQDLPSAIDVYRINQILGEETIPFIAIDPNYRDILINHIINSLGLTSEDEQIVIQASF